MIVEVVTPLIFSGTEQIFNSSEEGETPGFQEYYALEAVPETREL